MDTIFEDQEFDGFNSDNSYDDYSDDNDDNDDDCIEIVNLLNLFMVYYKKIFGLKPNTNMFEGIEYKKETDTNKIMEMFYDEMDKYKNSHPDARIIIDYDELNFHQDIAIKSTELYVAHINNTPRWYCGSLLCLLKYISDQKISNDQWSVYQHKKIKD